MYLMDTNVWLERLLHQERSDEVGEFFKRSPSDRLCITDIALHSIGVVLSRLGQLEAFISFVRERLDVSFATASKLVDQFQSLGLLEETTGATGATGMRPTWRCSRSQRRLPIRTFQCRRRRRRHERRLQFAGPGVQEGH